jgi:glycosyltransferase involved in cell wall biosynthesis
MQERLPLVSIIIPCYNAETYVGEAIRSALDQSWSATEVIVIDDGSSDCSFKIIESFGKRLRHEGGPNRGGCAARNRGIALALGEFIQFLDADDILLPDCVSRKLEWRLRAQDETPVCDVLYRSIEKKESTIGLESQDDDSICALMLKAPLVSAPLHRTSELKAVGGFREGLRAKQEVDLHVRMAMQGTRFVRLPEVLAVWRQTPGSVSSDSAAQAVVGASLLSEWTDLVVRHNLMTAHRTRFLSCQLARAGRNAIQRGDFKTAEALISKARSVSRQGWLKAYSNPIARIAVRGLGPRIAERLLGVYHSMCTY